MRKRLLIAVAVAAPLPATAQVSPVRDNIDALIEAHAKANGVPASFIHRVVKRESGYNPRAVGRGGAMGLMQIKHGTARALGYSGSPAGLLDARINLTYGVAYLAGAYKTAHGNEAQAYSYYARGYYYAAKRAGIRTDVAELEAPPVREQPANPLNKFLGSVFGARQTATTATASADPSVAALAGAYAQQAAAQPYALPTPTAQPQPVMAQPAQAPVQAPVQMALAQEPSAQAAAEPTVTVPLPPVRPAALAFHAAPAPAAGQALAYAGSGSTLAFPTSGQTVSLAATPAAASPAPATAPAAATTVAALEPAAAPAEPEAGPKMPLPPRRPVEFRHFVVRKPAPPVPQTAAAAPEPAAAVSQ
ncbi:Transglycosylase SLT domain-containing protein [Methylobacterium sp. 174MFSha1.1]|uniref:lytic transglycosylase domain-containing protein n=1 Tax=Methylobacterium sp. 174MFSha1.1 TaxID=1502749 RepID=UPI0008DF2BCA|nr:transglycosylase SLT domain-containing protein [Methylobacterium sp. 174MFSha1.1]SFU71458.1 Transglycosylase SLT domain-containing protein [Methylobacterium sp. 174MFSha1.1]